MRRPLSTVLLATLALAAVGAGAEDAKTKEFEENLMRSCIQDNKKQLEGAPDSEDINDNRADNNELILVTCFFRGYNIFDKNDEFHEENFRAFLRGKFEDQSIAENIADKCSERVGSDSSIDEKTKILFDCMAEMRSKRIPNKKT